MTKEWVMRKQQEADKEYEENLEKLIHEIKTTQFLDADEKERSLKLIEDNMISIVSHILIYASMRNTSKEFASWKDMIEDLLSETYYKRDYSNYEDREIFLSGDVLITDPCYFVKEEDDDKVNFYDSSLEAIGIPHSYCHDTIYGDWSCTVIDQDEKDIGNFCADAGAVVVALWDEVKKYNPAFNYPQTRPWTACIIKDFEGTVKFSITEDDGYMTLEILGNGKNKKTGAPFSFRGFQTGL